MRKPSFNQVPEDECQVCGKSFATREALSKHSWAAHKVMIPYQFAEIKCPWCMTWVQNQNELGVHITSNHKEEAKLLPAMQNFIGVNRLKRRQKAERYQQNNQLIQQARFWKEPRTAEQKGHVTPINMNAVRLLHPGAKKS